MSRAVNTSFGSYLRELRANKSYSLKQLEELTGVSASYLNRMENGTRQSPSFPIVEKLAEHLGVETLQLCQIAMNNKAGDFDERKRQNKWCTENASLLNSETGILLCTHFLYHWIPWHIVF